MKNWLVIVAVVVVVMPMGVQAVEETTRQRKTAAEIEAYKAQMRQEKQAYIEAEKARLREAKQSQVEEYRTRLQALKDQRKQVVVDNLNKRICTLNQTRTKVLLGHLERMSKILDRVETRAGVAKENGKDISEVESAVATAREKIRLATDAVNAQSSRECVINLTGSEETAGTEVRAAINQLQTELRSVHQKIKEARQAVATAIRQLAQVLGEKVSISLEEGE